jgi:hypothetical protein
MKMDGARLLYLFEVCQHFDWMREEIAHGRIDVLDDETCVLFAAKAVQQVDGVAPVYGHMRPHIKEGLVRSCIVFQCWERNKLYQTTTTTTAACESRDTHARKDSFPCRRRTA